MPPERQHVGIPHSPADAEILQRLRSAEGHLRAVIAMLEAGEPCEALLHQLGAVQAALRAAGARLLDCQINTSEEIIRHNSCPEERAAALSRLHQLYSLLTQYPDNVEKVKND